MEELKKKMLELSNALDDIGWGLDNARDTLSEMENAVYKKDVNAIKNIEDFKRELKRDRLYSENMDYFIDNYMRYYNK